MIYAIIALAVLVLVLYACGCFITRAILKATETTDKDDLYPVLCWPWIIIAAVGELIIYRQFKW